MKEFPPVQCYASVALAMAVCPSVCPSATSRYCIETAKPIELTFSTEDTLGLFYIVLEGKSEYLQK